MTYMWNQKKKKKRKKQNSNRNRVIDIENKLVVARVEGRWEG